MPSKQQPRRVPELIAPSGLACSESALFVACRSTHQVHQLELQDMSLVRSVGGPGSDMGELASPQGLALTATVLIGS